MCAAGDEHRIAVLRLGRLACDLAGIVTRDDHLGEAWRKVLSSARERSRARRTSSAASSLSPTAAAATAPSARNSPWSARNAPSAGTSSSCATRPCATRASNEAALRRVSRRYLRCVARRARARRSSLLRRRTRRARSQRRRDGRGRRRRRSRSAARCTPSALRPRPHARARTRRAASRRTPRWRGSSPAPWVVRLVDGGQHELERGPDAAQRAAAACRQHARNGDRAGAPPPRRPRALPIRRNRSRPPAARARRSEARAPERVLDVAVLLSSRARLEVVLERALLLGNEMNCRPARSRRVMRADPRVRAARRRRARRPPPPPAVLAASAPRPSPAQPRERRARRDRRRASHFSSVSSRPAASSSGLRRRRSPLQSQFLPRARSIVPAMACARRADCVRERRRVELRLSRSTCVAGTRAAADGIAAPRPPRCTEPALCRSLDHCIGRASIQAATRRSSMKRCTSAGSRRRSLPAK